MPNKNIAIKLTLIHKTFPDAYLPLLNAIIQFLISGSQVSERRKKGLFNNFSKRIKFICAY
jgi:hypothetical protein